MKFYYIKDKAGNTLTIYNSNTNNYGEIREDLSEGDFNVQADEDTGEAIDGVEVVTKNEYWSNKIIKADLYIGLDAILTINDNVTITGNVYVLGALKIYGGVTINGTLYGCNMTWGGSSTLYNGSIVMSGSTIYLL